MRRSLMLCLALGALAATACDAELSPGATLLQSAEETRAEDSARVSYVALFEADAARTSVSLTGEGVFDLSQKRGRMLFDMAGMMASDPPEGAEDVEMIVDGSLLYLQMPFLADVLPESRPWIKVDLEAAVRSNRTDLVQFTQLSQGDPTQAIELLRGVTREVEEVGTERVRGTATTHYEAALDLSRVARATPAESMPSMQTLLARSESSELPADVWVDRQGRLRRLRYTLDLRDGSVTSEVSATAMAVTMELFDFGVAVDVTPPAEERVIDLLGLAQQG